MKKTLDIQSAAAAKYGVSDLQFEVADECFRLFGDYGYDLIVAGLFL